MEDLKYCACGCGETLFRFDRWGRPRDFISGHNSRIKRPPLDTRKCQSCGKDIEVRKRMELSTKKYCSKLCFGVGMSKRTHTEETKQKISLSQSGRHLSEGTKTKMSLSKKGKRYYDINPFYGRHHTKESKAKFSGENHPNWKGDNVGYMALHTWVRRKLGTPSICMHCQKIFTGRNIQWANKSHMYKRDVNDWIRLCTPCHRKYDQSSYL